MGPRLSRISLLRILWGCLAAALVAACASSAGASLFSDFSIKDEAELGRKFALTVRSRMPLIEDPEVKDYVRSIVARLSEKLPPQPFPFVTDVILHGSMNAFAVPGGYVFVHTGLIIQLDHESELAGVIAHELAHVTQRHVANRIDRSKYTTLATMAAALAGALLSSKGDGNAGGALLAGGLAAGQSSMLSYGRIDETEADQIGLQYLVKAGYNPRGMLGSFEKIRKRQWTAGLVVPEYLSTHPDILNRINDVSNRIRTLPGWMTGLKEDDRRFNRVKTLLLARYGQSDVANHAFEKAPEDPLAVMGRGIVAARGNRINQAKDLFERAVSLAPGDPLVQREAGAFYYGIGSPRADVLLSRALALDPKDSMAQYWQARLLEDAGRLDDAQTMFRLLLKRYPDDAELHHYLGVSLGKSRHPCEGWLHLAYAAMYRGQHGKSEQCLRKAKAAAATEADKRLLDAFTKIRQARTNPGD